MQLTRCGVYRNCGTKWLIRQKDRVRYHQAEGGGLIVEITSLRKGDTRGYNHELFTTAEEVLKFLFSLQPSEIAQATNALRDEFDLPDIIPEVMKQLARGALQAPAADTEDADE
jgi:hypothetical protein